MHWGDRIFEVRHPAPSCANCRRRAFTLIELILVMALLAIAISLIVPRLANFFRGRTIDAETRQLLALMHHGQSRAVSAGVPMVLWIDDKQSTYGLKEEPGYTEQDRDAVEFTLEKELQFEIPDPGPSLSAAPLASTLSSGNQGSQSQIRFLPDGTIAETSPRTVRLVDRNGGSAIALTQSRGRSQYEIQSQTNEWTSAK
jgi:prepilin-type N-terminal cleavage/methylation domain-containing protein